MEQSRRPREARADRPPQPARPARPSPPRRPLVRTHARSAAIGTITAAKDARAFRDVHCVSSDRETERRRHHRRASGSLGQSATQARLPRVMHPPRGHPRGHSCSSRSQHPLPLPRSRHRASRNPLALLRFARILPNRTLRSWAESGAGSDPLRSYDLQPRNPDFCKPFCYLSGVAPSPRLRRD